MSKSIWVLTVVTVVAIGGVVALTQAGSSTPAHAATKLSPPTIPEFTPLPCPPNPVSTPEVLGCVQKRILAADKKIDRLGGTLFSELGEDRFRRKFLADHRAWLAYRSADCLGVAAIYEEGTIFPIVVGECEVARDEERLKDLRTFRHDLNNP